MPLCWGLSRLQRHRRAGEEKPRGEGLERRGQYNGVPGGGTLPARVQAWPVTVLCYQRTLLLSCCYSLIPPYPILHPSSSIQYSFFSTDTDSIYNLTSSLANISPPFPSQGGAMTCVTPSTVLFNDLDPASQEKWTDVLQTQPAEGWDDVVTYCGWKDISSTYLVCEGDAVIPPPMQVQIAEMADCKIEKCGAGHMCMLSMPEKVVEVIKSAAVATVEA